MNLVWHEKGGTASPPVTLHELAHGQRLLGHQYALLAEGGFERFRNLLNAVSIIGDKGQDRDILLITLPESHAFGDGETIKAGADFLTNELLHHRLGHSARVRNVATKEQLKLHLGNPLN